MTTLPNTPYYGGGQVKSPVDSFQTSGIPSTANIQHNLPTLAVDPSTQALYALVGKSGGTADWITLGGTGGVSQYTQVTADTQMVVGQGYIANKAGTICTLTLPATANVGATVQVLGKGSTLWSIAQNSGQTIRMNGASSTTGATGSLSAIDQYNSATLVCITANTDWEYVGGSGILTIL